MSHVCAASVIDVALPRRERDWVLGEFKAGRSPILIATDVASRGLGMFSLSRKRYRCTSPCHDERSCYHERSRHRRRRRSRRSFRSGVRRQSKTGEDDRRAQRDQADSLPVMAQFPLTSTRGRLCASGPRRLAAASGRHSMNSHRTFLVWSGCGYGLVGCGSRDSSVRSSRTTMRAQDSCLSVARTRWTSPFLFSAAEVTFDQTESVDGAAAGVVGGTRSRPRPSWRSACDLRVRESCC